MEIRIAELKEHLYLSLELIMEANGFKLKKSLSLFEKKVNDIKYVLKFLFHVRSHEIAIEVFALIYYIPAEKLYKKASGISMETIGNEIGKLFRNPDGKMVDHRSEDICISERSELDFVVEKVLSMFNSVALPYYQRFNTIDDIDSVLNDNPTEVSVHANAQYFRCPNALIVAKLAKRQDYNELEKIYNERMSTVSEVFKERYDKVKDLLLNA